MVARKFLFVILAVAFGAQIFFADGKKVALVIGNSSYQHVSPLGNPKNDASDMASALQRIGFTILVRQDCDRKTMRIAIDEFNKQIKGSGIAFFYYAGHGLQFSGENYLVPIDAEVEVAGDVPDECVPLSRIIGRMDEAGAGTNVVILDACRDNPFASVSRGIDRGLVVVARKPPESIIVYAAAENEKADDGTDRNGPFTAALLANMEKPLSFTDVLYSVKDAVRKATGNRQQPAVYDNLTHPIYLAGNSASNKSQDNSTLTLVPPYGMIKIIAADGGALYLDGVSKGVLPAGYEGNLDNVAVGSRSLELHYPDGSSESKSVYVQKGQSVNVAFSQRLASASNPNSVEKVYSIGDRGPAGGWIFYDKGSYADGWRYLEAAPSDQSGWVWYRLLNDQYPDVKTGTAVGTGKANTAAIIAIQGPGDYAASFCMNLTINGYSDWFLPSKDELDLMYTNLKRVGLGGFGEGWLWSSSQDNISTKFAWVESFSSGDQNSSGFKSNQCAVRACRAFTAGVSDSSIIPDQDSAQNSAELQKQMREVNDLIDKGMAALGKADFATAKTDFSDAQKRFPDGEDRFASQKLADIADSLYTVARRNPGPDADQAIKDAIQASRDAKKKDASNALPFYTLGKINSDFNQTDNAMTELKQATSLDPKNYLYSYELGKACLKSRDYEMARQAFDTTVTLKPDFENAWYDLGLSYQYLKNSVDALDAFSKAIKIKPDFTLALVGIGRLYAAQNQQQAALATFQKAAQSDPTNSLALHALAVQYVAVGDYSSAEIWFRKALAVSDDALTNYNFATVELKLDKGKEALPFARKAVAQQPNDPTYLYTLGLASERAGDAAAAIDAYAKAAQQDKTYVAPRINIGNLYLEAGFVDKALAYLEEAVAIDPLSFEANNNLANAYGKKGLYDKSILSYQKALGLSPRETTVRLNLARVYASSGDYANAIAAYADLVKLDPKQWDALYELGKLQASTGDAASAKKTLQDLLARNPDYPEAAAAKKMLAGL